MKVFWTALFTTGQPIVELEVTRYITVCGIMRLDGVHGIMEVKMKALYSI